MSQVFKPPRHPGDPRETTDISIRKTGRPVPIPRPELRAVPNFAVILYYGASL